MTKLKSAEEWLLTESNVLPDKSNLEQSLIQLIKQAQQNAIEAAISECEIELFAITQDQDLVNAVGNIRNGKALQTQVERSEKQKEFDRFIEGMAKLMIDNSENPSHHLLTTKI